ncbi:MAG: tRNA-dihydrouridine synthase family protein [Paludibacteraceae bacterium]|nr:tRNA-dihydrouridine synthase family protein [Paludibacteraceae bacterium]
MKQKIHFAPLQGYTDYCYRNAFDEIFGGVSCYYTPFLRVERGTTRNRDLYGIKKENNKVACLIPQIMAGDEAEFDLLLGVLTENGYSAIDINLGCPYPLITKRQKGAGILPHPDKVEELLSNTTRYPNVDFSVKMRLGMSQPDECLALLPILEKYGIKQVTMHARLGEQQYKGEVDMEAFSAFYEACSLPLVYNGDVQTVDDLQRISEQFPKLSGIMVGRGLLAHPELAMEYQTGKVLSDSEKMALYSRLHSVVYSHYQERLNGGEPQILDKMKEFWEYFYPEMDKKRRKAIKKATSISKYEAAVVF